MPAPNTPHVCVRPECGKEFMAPEVQRYCSKDCVAEARRKNPRRDPRTGPHICLREACAKEYTPTGRAQKYCSKQCWRVDAIRRWGSKQCSNCPADKAVWTDRDGLLRCGPCSRYWQRRGVERPEIQIRAGEARRKGLKLCRRCERELPRNQFRRERKGALRSNCMACMRVYLREWHEANPDHVASQRAKYNASPIGRAINHAASVRKKARKREAVVEVFDPFEIFERDKWICQGCKKRVSKKAKAPDPKSATLDHMVPLSRGGKHERANVQLMHYGCNASKNNRYLPQGEQLLLFG